MNYYFVGGEDSDLKGVGNVSVDTAGTTYRRAAYSRCSLGVVSDLASGWQFSLGATRSSFWLTAMVYWANYYLPYQGNDLIAFYDGAVPRIKISGDGNNPGHFRIQKVDASGTVTTLSTSVGAMPNGACTRLDVFVNYGTSGEVSVYAGGLLVASYSGNVVTNSATGLDSVLLKAYSGYSGSGSCYWSEVAAADADTRAISGIMTLVPTGAGNSSSWSGSYGNINETVLDSNNINSGTANQVSQFTITPTGTIASGSAVGAVVVSARGHIGSSGPQNLQASVRTSSTDYFSSNLPVAAAYKALQAYWLTNPNTSAAWSAADLNAGGFNIGVKSIT
jgi:hypothetical protein